MDATLVVSYFNYDVTTVWWLFILLLMVHQTHSNISLKNRCCHSEKKKPSISSVIGVDKIKTGSKKVTEFFFPENLILSSCCSISPLCNLRISEPLYWYTIEMVVKNQQNRTLVSPAGYKNQNVQKWHQRVACYITFCISSCSRGHQHQV